MRLFYREIITLRASKKPCDSGLLRGLERVLLGALIKFPNSGKFEALAGVHFISRFLANLTFLAFSFSYRLWGSLSASVLQGDNHPQSIKKPCDSGLLRGLERVLLGGLSNFPTVGNLRLLQVCILSPVF